MKLKNIQITNKPDHDNEVRLALTYAEAQNTDGMAAYEYLDADEAEVIVEHLIKTFKLNYTET